MKEIRKIQLTGKSTYIVSLPKKWVLTNKLKQGDTVILSYDSNKILISPGDIADRKSVEYRVEDDEPFNIVRQVISYYLAGYEAIKIIFGKKAETIRALIKKVIRKKMIGFEITDEGRDYIEIRSLLRHGEMSLSSTINRLLRLTEIILRDTLQALYNCDKALAENIIVQDDDVDRLYLFIIRMIRFKISYFGLNEEFIEPYEYVIYNMFVKTIERIADHAVRIAHIVTSMKAIPPKELYNAILTLMGDAVDLYSKAYRAFLNRDVREANRVICSVKNLTATEKEIVRKLEESKLSVHQAILMRILLESIRRIGEYAADIGEMTVDISTAPPKVTI